MAIERKWVEFAASPAPRAGRAMYVSLNQRGLIVLNRHTYKAMGEPEAVQLLFDADNVTIGLRPCELLMPNAFKINRRGESGTHIITATRFTKAHQINPTGTIRFLKPHIEDGVLILDIGLTARTTQTPRTGWRKRVVKSPAEAN